ncbi:hypothetical protein OE88DRAFT_1665016 [Heliocybe sulcata]|uniref:F-box domain-containing protein n=1 Tax=Heliocybe sulcata TaxID=5364 RepID=A0A5C3MSQ8_9AGAM|nr:hypothetical protein OE88DRAFT_1665016 [Heliocybe sulcata]
MGPLTTNTGLNRVQLQAHLAQTDDLLERLESERNEGEQKLRAIQSEIDRLRIKRVVLEGLHYKLLPELWYRIFDILLLQEDQLDSADDSSEGFYRAITLAQVCHAWRDLLLSNSRYWAVILLRGDVAAPGAQAALQAYKERSDKRALDLVFLPSLKVRHPQNLTLLRKQIDFALSHLIFEREPWRSLTCESRDPTSMTNFIQSLSSFLPRLRSLRLSLHKPYPGPMHLSGEESALFMSAPYQLETLHLRHISPLAFPMQLFSNVRFATLKCPGRKPELRLSHVIKFARNAPVLESLIIEGNPSYDIFVPNPLSQLFTSEHPDRPVLLQNLLELTWAFIYPKEVYQLLLFLETPCLETLTLYLRNTAGGYSLAQNLFLDRPLEYKSLKSLHLHYVDLGAINWCLKSITFPNLQRLSIDNDDFETRGMPDSTPFSSLFHIPAMPSLTHLSLFRMILTADSLGEKTLSYLPSLRCLKIDSCFGTKDLLECLGLTSIIFGRRNTVCPLLEELVCLDCGDMQFDVLSDFIRKRNASESAPPAFDANAWDASSALGAPRRIKALRKGLTSSPNVAAGIHSPTDLQEEVKPSKIIKVDVRGCPDVSREQLESLWDLGVKFICGERRGRWVTEVTWKEY